MVIIGKSQIAGGALLVPLLVELAEVGELPKLY